MIHKIPLRCSYLLFGCICLISLSACTASDTPQAITASPSPATTTTSMLLLSAGTTFPTASPTPTASLTPTATPTPDWPDPNWGPVPEGALIRLGKGEPMGLAISPDGQFIVVGSHLGAFLYRLDTHERIWYQINAGAVDDVAYSPDGRWVAAAAGLDVLLLDAESGTLVHSWQVPDDPDEYFRDACEVAFSPDGSLLASISGNGKIALWDIAQGKMKRILQHDSGGMSYPCGLAFSPDGATVASAVDSYLTLFSITSGQAFQSMRGEPGGGMGFEPITDVSFSPDGKTVVTGNGGLWDVQSGREILRLDGLDQSLMAFSPDGKNIASDSSGRMTLWDAASGAEVWSMEHSHMYWVNDLQFLPGGEALAVAFAAESIVFFDAKSGKTLDSIEGHFETMGLTFSKDSHFLASWDWGEIVRVWDLNSLRLAHTFTNAEISDYRKIQPLHSSQNLLPGVTFIPYVEYEATSPDGKIRATVDTAENSISFWDLSSDILIGYLGDAGWGVAYSPDGRYLATVASDGSIYLWDANLPLPAPPEELSLSTPTPEPTSTPAPTPTPPPNQLIQPNAGTILDLAYSTDGTRLTILTEEGLFSFQNSLLDEKLRWPLDPHRYTVAVSPDGKFAAISGKLENKTGVHLWNAISGQYMRTLTTDTQSWANTPVFSNDGRWLAGNIDDGLIAIWNVNTGQLARTIYTKEAANYTFDEMAFSPDGKIISAGSSSQLFLWSLETGELAIGETLCRGDITYDQAYSPDSKTLLIACGPFDYPLGFLSFWDVPGQKLSTYWDECGSIHSLAYSPDGEMVALGYYDGWLELWSENGQPFYWLGHAEPRESWYAWDDDGNLIGVEHEITALAFSPNSKRLASGSLDGRVFIWDVSDLKLVPSPSGCTLRIGQQILAEENARLWSRPDASKGSIAIELIPGQSIYILSGPVYGPVLRNRSLSGWFWEVSLTSGGESSGWIWQDRVEECK